MRECRKLRAATGHTSNLGVRRPSMSEPTENKEVIRDYVETWNQGDLNGLCTYWSSDMRHYTRTQSHDYEAVKGIVGNFMQAFPDLRFNIEDIIAEGDRVVTRMTARATNTGSYMGLP